VLSVEPKQGWYLFWLFFKIGICSALSLKRSRRELYIDVAEYRPTLKNYQNTHHLRFRFIPKTGVAFPKRDVVFSVIFKRIYKSFSTAKTSLQEERVGAFVAPPPESLRYFFLIVEISEKVKTARLPHGGLPSVGCLFARLACMCRRRRGASKPEMSYQLDLAQIFSTVNFKGCTFYRQCFTLSRQAKRQRN